MVTAKSTDVAALPTTPLSKSNSLNSVPFEAVARLDEGERSAKPYQIPIIYKLACVDTTQQKSTTINRYSATPFEGLEKHENRQTLSVIDILDGITGMPMPGAERRANQNREDFGTDRLRDQNKPFIVGEDFIARTHLPRSVRIMSPFLIDFLKCGLQYYPDEISDSELIVTEPYELLAYNYNRLAEAIEGRDGVNERPSMEIDHLKVLWNWFHPHYCKEIEPEILLHQAKRVTYQKLWLLYKPGTIVFTGEGNQIDCYIVHRLYHPLVKVSSGYREQTWVWSLSLWRFDFDGSRLVRSTRGQEVQVSQFFGDKDIAKLQFIPIGFMNPDQGTKQELIDRGKLHYKLVRQAPVLQRYGGALSGNKTLQYSGGVIIDPVGYRERQQRTATLGTITYSANVQDFSKSQAPDDGGGGPLYSRYNDIPITEEDPFENEELYILLPSAIKGFALGKKQWAHFDTSSFKESPSTATHAFDDLVMDSNDIELLRAVGKSSQRTAAGFQQADFVEGKGSGKVVLLHGPPGVGKSFTVECLARDLQRPLLALTVADIGTDQSTIEGKLSGWLDLAQRWDAVVLLDEADAYLERRNHDQLSRNALVTVFLRVLEYYPGIIFLTTNQPGYIDDAFISRFHLCVEYKPMDPKARTGVWRNFLHKHHKEQEALTETQPRTNIMPDIENYVTTNADVVEFCLNGRDIRNAFQAAVTVAYDRTESASRGCAFNKVELKIADFEKVIANKKAFHDYISNLEGQTEADRAFARGARGLSHAKFS